MSFTLRYWRHMTMAFLTYRGFRREGSVSIETKADVLTPEASLFYEGY